MLHQAQRVLVLKLLLQLCPLRHLHFQAHSAAVQTFVPAVLLTAWRLLSLLPLLQTAGQDRASDLNHMNSVPDAAAEDKHIAVAA
jgi:hypothetical protein